MDSGPSTSRHSSSRWQRTRVDDEEEEERPTFEAEPGFIAKATEHGKNFLAAYKNLVKIYPDRKSNFDVNISKLLEIYLSSVLHNTCIEDHRTLALLDFAKAGLVVQGSTSIYSKKVDFVGDLLAELLSFVESGVASEETEDGGDVRPHASRRSSSKDINFSPIDIQLNSKSSCKMNLDRRGGDKKLNFKPRCFPVLLRQEQCDKDKQHITMLNPSFAGDKTTFRLWGPLSGQQGLLVSDLSNIKFNPLLNNLEESIGEDDAVWDSGPPNISDVENEDNPAVATTTDISCGNIDMRVAHQAAAASPLHIIDAQIITQEENKENTTNSESEWAHMDIAMFVPDRELKAGITKIVSKRPAILELHVALMSKLNNKIGRPKRCFGEAINEFMHLQQEGKMLEDKNSRKSKKKLASSLITPASIDATSGKDLFKDSSSDTEDVAGFDEDGDIVYATPFTELPAPTIEDTGWHEADDDDMFLNDDVIHHSETPGSSTNTNIDKSDSPSTKEDDDLPKRLEEWYEKINKLQAVESSKPKFSFDSYCRKVLDQFPPDEEKLKFKSVAAGLPAGQIARYLLATLQLANTRNVEIIGNIPGEISNQSLEIVLLNKSRVLPSFEEDET